MMTVFEQCCAASCATPAGLDQDEAAEITRAVLETLLEGTESIRTKDELRRILAEAD